MSQENTTIIPVEEQRRIVEKADRRVIAVAMKLDQGYDYGWEYWAFRAFTLLRAADFVDPLRNPPVSGDSPRSNGFTDGLETGCG